MCARSQQETGSTQANHPTEHFPVFHGLGKEKLLFRRDFGTPRSSISPSSPNLTPSVSKGQDEWFRLWPGERGEGSVATGGKGNPEREAGMRCPDSGVPSAHLPPPPAASR